MKELQDESTTIKKQCSKLSGNNLKCKRNLENETKLRFKKEAESEFYQNILQISLGCNFVLSVLFYMSCQRSKKATK